MPATPSVAPATGMWIWAFIRTFALNEQFKLQFRAEMYNAFNHANLYVQSGDVDVSQAAPFVDAAYGQKVDGTKDYRTVQLALRLTF